MSSSGPLSEPQIFLIKASEDEQALQLNGLSDSILGFHAQQAVEKLFKALLSQLQVPYERTHELDRLHLLLLAAGEKLPQIPLSLSDLTDYAVVYRYDLLYQKNAFDTADLIETVRILREHITARIAALSSLP
jgi:HEPN domain-containing protein